MKRLNKAFGKMFFWTDFRVPTPWQQLRDKIDTWSSILVHAVVSLTRANAKRRLSCFDWVVWKNRTFRPLWYENFSFYLSGILKEQRSDLKIDLCWMNSKYWNDLWLSSSLVYAARCWSTNKSDHNGDFDVIVEWILEEIIKKDKDKSSAKRIKILRARSCLFRRSAAKF